MTVLKDIERHFGKDIVKLDAEVWYSVFFRTLYYLIIRMWMRLKNWPKIEGETSSKKVVFQNLHISPFLRANVYLSTELFSRLMSVGSDVISSMPGSTISKILLPASSLTEQPDIVWILVTGTLHSLGFEEQWFWRRWVESIFGLCILEVYSFKEEEVKLGELVKSVGNSISF